MKKKSNKINFSAKVSLGRGLDKVSVDFSIKTEKEDGELSLTYDEVFDSAVEATEKTYPYSDFPKMSVDDLFIKTKDGVFPVYAEDCDKKTLEENKCGKALILPYATYSLTPEFSAYLKLKDMGMADFPFDPDKMRNLVETIKNI